MRPNSRVLGIYLLGVFLGALDTGVLGPAFPLIGRSFGVSLSWEAWAVTTYTVAYVASTVVAGPAGDRYGRRRVFGLGVAAFGVASALAAASGTFWLFLAARVIQGAGAGAVYPNAQAEGVAQFPPERRGTALGMFGAVFGLATIVGPNVGGALAQFVGWPAIFVLNVPAAAAVLLLLPRLPATETVPDRALPDWSGGLAFAGCLAALLLTVAVSGPARLPLGALTLAAAAVLVWRQRAAVAPFIDSRPLARPSGAALVFGAAMIGTGMSAAVFIPTLAQRVLGMGVFASGVALMPAALSGAVLAGVVGVLVDRVGPRLLLQVGMGAAVVGGLLLARPHLTLAIFIAAMLTLGLSTAATMGAPLNRIALALYRDDQAGQALALAAVFRSVGLAAGPVVLTVVQARHGFPGMFLGVAVAAAAGGLAFLAVPDVAPSARSAASRATAAAPRR